MREMFELDRNSLVVQIVLSFLALILLTTTAVGLPAVLLIRSQAERQTLARIDQGSQATGALYDAWQRRIDDLAFLTSQRPTLQHLLSQQQTAALTNYLQALQKDTELDLLLICNADGRAIIQTNVEAPADLCLPVDPSGLHVASPASSPQIWMVAAHTIGDKSTGLGRILAGMALDDDFARQMKAQTSLDHTLLVDGQPAASSLSEGTTACCDVTRQPTLDSAAVNSTQLIVDNRPYISKNLPLSSNNLVDEIALDVGDIAAAEHRLTWTLVGSIILVALAGSILGVIMARRISQPLTRLTDAATAISRGDLSTSLSVSSPVREVSLVSQALESARIDLQKTLNELQQERAWTNHLLEAIAEGIVALDENGRIIFFSPGAERIAGWNKDEALNRTCDELFHLSEPGGSFSERIPPPGQQSKVFLDREDGRQITLGVTSALFSPPNTDKTGLVLVLRDISEAELTHRLMGGFLANITHEFRTPLSALAASTELLLDQAPDLSPAELQQLLTSLYMGIIGLQTLIDNLLESASLETGRFRVYPRPSDLGEIIAEATHMTQPLQEKHGQWLVVEMPATIPLVQADSRRIVQVLVNLLFNAIKYSPDETKIILGATVSEGWVRITVADRGPGIPPGRRDELFYQFVHYDTDNAKSHHGAGLGLSVVKAIVEAHNGQVGVDGHPGGGAIFWFTLPVVEERESV
jgi:PAS domain S-box-containing protein